MATTSVMLALRTPAPPFALPDVVSGQIYSLNSFIDKTALLVMFMCRHCPYVVHVEQGIAKIGRDYKAQGLVSSASAAMIRRNIRKTRRRD